jgi:hypothetical protein
LWCHSCLLTGKCLKQSSPQTSCVQGNDLGLSGSSIGFALVGTYRMTKPHRRLDDVFGSLPWINKPSCSDAWPALTGHGTDRDSSMYSFGIDWFADNKFPAVEALSCSTNPNVWVPTKNTDAINNKQMHGNCSNAYFKFKNLDLEL